MLEDMTVFVLATDSMLENTTNTSFNTHSSSSIFLRLIFDNVHWYLAVQFPPTPPPPKKKKKKKKTFFNELNKQDDNLTNSVLSSVSSESASRLHACLLI